MAGTLARAALAQALPVKAGAWPWATFVVNLAGATLLGWVLTHPRPRLPLGAHPRPLLGTGFCAAFTTFSTMQLELVHMLDAHRYVLALAYALASVALGLLAVFVSITLTRRASGTA